MSKILFCAVLGLCPIIANGTTAPTIPTNAKSSMPVPGTPIPVITEDDSAYWNEIVPGEIIVFYNDNTVNVKKASSLKELGITEKGVSLISKGVDNKWIVVNVQGGVAESKAFIKSMKTKSMVRFAEPNRIYRPAVNPNDTYFESKQWDKVSMNAPGAWDHGWGDTIVSVGIIDMGISYTHSDLAGRFGTLKGYDYRDSDADPINASSGEWHATHCAGIAAATINNNAGIAGMGNSRLYALRFMNSTSGTSTALANSIIWCVNNGVWVISMSTAGPNYSGTIDYYCQAAWSYGRLLFAATGNDGAETFCYPAADTGVIAIGGMSQAGARLSYSNYGSHTKFVAPGEAIYSTYPGGSYYTSQGTSMACPQAAGGAALVWSMKPTRTNAEIRDILIATAVDISPAGKDKYTGYGKMNLGAAVDLAIGIEESKTQEQKLSLDVSPNPATKKANISLFIPTTQHVSLKLYDATGRLAKTIIDESKPVGNYNTTINTTNLNSGIYFIKLNTTDTRISKKITLIK
ncbi:MAG: S8 family serine peptidase [bacterium]|nr:S8 family serine peptidase [bacterium]